MKISGWSCACRDDKEDALSRSGREAHKHLLACKSSRAAPIETPALSCFVLLRGPRALRSQRRASCGSVASPFTLPLTSLSPTYSCVPRDRVLELYKLDKRDVDLLSAVAGLYA